MDQDYRARLDAALANLASLNEIVAEMMNALRGLGVGDDEFAKLVHVTLRDASWRLGFEFRGERGVPAGEFGGAQHAQAPTGSAWNPSWYDRLLAGGHPQEWPTDPYAANIPRISGRAVCRCDRDPQPHVPWPGCPPTGRHHAPPARQGGSDG